MNENNFENSLLESAEHSDRMLRPERVELLRQSYVFFKSTGLSDEEVKATMALTTHEMRLIMRKI